MSEVSFLRATYDENLCRTGLHSNPDASFLDTDVVGNGADRERASIGVRVPSMSPASKDDRRLLAEKLAALKASKRTKLYKANYVRVILKRLQDQVAAYKANFLRAILKRLAEEVAALEVPFLGATYSENLCRTSLRSSPDASFLSTNVVDNGAGRELYRAVLRNRSSRFKLLRPHPLSR